MKKYKHRLVVEATFNQQVTERQATLLTNILLDRLGRSERAVRYGAKDFFCSKLAAKAFTQVTKALNAKRNQGTYAVKVANVQMKNGRLTMEFKFPKGGPRMRTTMKPVANV